MVEIIKDISGNVQSAYAEGSFGKAKKKIESQGYRIISLEENAKLRISEGKDAIVSQKGNWTIEDFIYIPDKGAYITKNSPMMKSAGKMAIFPWQGKESYLNSKEVDYALAKAVQVKDKKIPTDIFGEHELTVFCFGESAKAYGEFLKNAGINEIPVYLAACGEKPFARKMWLIGLGGRSGLNGNNTLHMDGGWVRGIK